MSTFRAKKMSHAAFGTWVQYHSFVGKNGSFHVFSDFHVHFLLYSAYTCHLELVALRVAHCVAMASSARVTLQISEFGWFLLRCLPFSPQKLQGMWVWPVFVVVGFGFVDEVGAWAAPKREWSLCSILRHRTVWLLALLSQQGMIGS